MSNVEAILNNFNEFLESYIETDDNENRLFVATGIKRNKSWTWDKYLSEVWNSGEGVNMPVIITIKIVIFFASALIIISGTISITRVYGTLLN